MLQVRANAFEIPAPAAPLRLLCPHTLDSRDEEAWDALGEDAETPSIFAEPWLMRRSLTHCDPGRRAALAVVEGQDGCWLGALPVAPALRQGRSPLPAWIAWKHPNQFVGSPLVRRGQAARFWGGLLDGLGKRGLRMSLLLGELPLDDPVTEALLSVCAEQNRAVVTDRRFARACLRGTAAPQQCAKQRSRIRGLERKLAGEVGPVSYELARDHDDIDGLLDSFLALERSGWKGRTGSALACAEGTRAFFRDTCRAAAARGRLELATLSAGGRLLAISTQLEGTAWAYGFKTAYDEAFARYAPGLLLLDRLTQSYVERSATGIDSCAAPDQQPVSRLWPDRRELIDCRVALGGAGRARLFDAMLACERAGHRLRARG